ncbi:hypothetical protein PAPYR_11545 [Paratrimastix pyriformis]|uniref:Uncharacterized protein n=1 Tax=Paratrimastix pyriformis TaxID=342808 RepID=A0ABQ8U939_9EUKA|nr:hypothetical protein PAPYR_11545 [Paratrimastix pyriformis]
MHIAEENHLSDFQVHFLKEHAQCGKREVFLEFFNRAEEDDLVFHDLDHISTFKNSMLDEFCKLFGHLGFSSGALPSSTLLKGIIESLQKGCSPAVSRDRIATTLHHLILATLRHPQLTTLLTLQLRQNVFLRVPINVVGDRDVSIPDRDCDGDSAVTSVDTLPRARALAVPKGALAEGTSPARRNPGGRTVFPGVLADQHIQIACSVPSCMHIAEENHLSDFQAHFLKEHAQCGKREVFLEFFNRAEEDDLVFHDLDHISCVCV